MWTKTSAFKQSLNRKTARGIRKMFESCGLVVARKRDYYSPLPSEAALRKTQSRWAKPSPLAGLDFDLADMKQRLLTLRDAYLEEFLALPPYDTLRNAGYGPGYTHVDAFTLYATIRKLRPRTYLEVGSGLSTYYCDLARRRNRDEGFDTKIICIEPFPFAKLQEIDQIQLIQSEVQDVALQTFQALESGDVLFIDSTHVVRIDGDVPYLFLEVLPAVPVGVHIHIHDIPFPYNIPYPANYWTLLEYPQAPKWPMYWTEAMLLQAFLAFNSDFKIELSCPMLRHSDESFIKTALPIYEPINVDPNAFSSIWLKRVR